MIIETLGSVDLVQQVASDLGVVNAARVSFGESHDTLSDADIGLIGFLMRNRHGSPFEHNLFTFRVECPIFVAREWFRHRWSSFNEVSGRYAELPDYTWVPSAEDIRTQKGKPGAYTFEVADPVVSDVARAVISRASVESRAAYRTLLELGVAKEVARVVLPVAQSTQFLWSVNARSLMNFLSLRNDAAAQKEIRAYAAAIEDMASACMPHTFAAFVASGRQAP